MVFWGRNILVFGVPCLVGVQVAPISVEGTMQCWGLNRNQLPTRQINALIIFLAPGDLVIKFNFGGGVWGKGDSNPEVLRGYSWAWL